MTGEHRQRLQWTRQRILIVVVAVLVALLLAVIGVVVFSPKQKAESAFTLPVSADLTDEELEALPSLRLDATVEGLLSYEATEVPESATFVYNPNQDTPVYGDNGKPVARLTPLNEYAAKTAVVVVEENGEWSLILTPTRSGNAVQGAGWVQTSALQRGQDIPQYILISAADRTLSIIGQDGTVNFTSSIAVSTDPTLPKGLGYVPIRYQFSSGEKLAPPVTLTSLYVESAKNFNERDASMVALRGGTDDGAVAGAVSMDEETAKQVEHLPIGTLVLVR